MSREPRTDNCAVTCRLRADVSRRRSRDRRGDRKALRHESDNQERTMAPTPVYERPHLPSEQVPHRAELPSGPPKLDREELRRAQQRTLDTPRMRYGLLARMMFKPVD